MSSGNLRQVTPSLAAADRSIDFSPEELGLAQVSKEEKTGENQAPQEMGSDDYVRVRSPELCAIQEQERRIFDELPRCTVTSAGEVSSSYRYKMELKYKQFTWILQKKATQVFMLHFSLKKRVLQEDLSGLLDQLKERFMKLTSPHDFDEELEQDHEVSRSHSQSRDVPSAAVFAVIRPSLARLPTFKERDNEIALMQNYFENFLKSLEIVNTEEVCKFLGVSALSFAPEYGPKLREGYVRVSHLPLEDKDRGCFGCFSFCCCCRQNWRKVWAVLKPGFLAFLADPFDPKPLDIIVFDVLSSTEGHIALAKLDTSNPLRHAFVVTCGNRNVRIKTKGKNGSLEWVAAINDAGLRPPEGWCHPHRYGSFAPPRGITADDSEAQWFIDGKASFDAIASAITGAKSEIYIADWWFCPELYLKRPYQQYAASRLDSLLGAKAKEGVQIYVLLYKEVALALKINSLYSKRRLVSTHENIKVLRYPDHFSSGVYLWSHHEKLVIVDQRICFLGGLDLCFGRYDDPRHLLSDEESVTWPGKDYYNPRESEPNSWEDTAKDELNRKTTPRMPWHDVQCAIRGPACRDVARHFVQRWNYAKRNKAPNEHKIPLLLPHHHMVIPHYLTGNEAKEALEEEEKMSLTPARSSYQDIPTLIPAVPDNAEEIVSADSGPKDMMSKLFENTPLLKPGSLFTRRSKSLSSWTDLQMQNFVDGGKLEVLDTINRADGNKDLLSGEHWWEAERTPRRADEDFNEVGPRVRSRCQVVRSVGQWSAGTSQLEETSIQSAYCSLIDKAEHFIYIENQFFISGLDGDSIIQNRVLESLYRRIIRAHKDRRCFRVIVLLPLLPGFQGGIDDAGAASVRAIMHWQYRTICRGGLSLMKQLQEQLGDEVEQYISFYGLRQHGKLSETGPLVTSQIYVHSKIMIVDDKVSIIGSANINDRSLLGSRDSEIGVVLEDDEFVDSLMNGSSWKAGSFSHSLRKALWVEHLGLHSSEADVVKDPVCDTTYRDIWMSTAELNTGLYDTIFGCIPNDSIHSRTALRQAAIAQKENVGYTSIDLGVASAGDSDFNGICAGYDAVPQSCAFSKERPLDENDECYLGKYVPVQAKTTTTTGIEALNPSILQNVFMFSHSFSEIEFVLQ